MAITFDPSAMIVLDAALEVPLFRQIYEQIRGHVLAKRLLPGRRLPSTRVLAARLGVSRTSVSAAYEQLMAEGYLEGRAGSGTFVSAHLPDDLAGHIARPGGVPTGSQTPLPTGEEFLSTRGQLLAALRPPKPAARQDLAPGLADLREFPFALWARLLRRSWRRPAAHIAASHDPAGYGDLRQVIADYLSRERGVIAHRDQVMIVSGAQQAIQLAAHALTDVGQKVLVEDPGYDGVRGALLGAGLQLVSVPVDDQGLDITSYAAAHDGAKLVCVAPSNQYPLGVTMSLPRRLALLDWAQAQQAWIIEDDYDSEFRYDGRPLAALQGLDNARRVLYIGSFSKVMFPSLRLGYLVLPSNLVAAFRSLRGALDDHPSMLAQQALHDFFVEGHFAAHLRRMRRAYSLRRQAMVMALKADLPDYLEVASVQAGMHLVAFLRPSTGLRDVAVAAAAEQLGLSLIAISPLYRRQPARQGLLIGFAAAHETDIPALVSRLAAAIKAAAGAT